MILQPACQLQKRTGKLRKILFLLFLALGAIVKNSDTEAGAVAGERHEQAPRRVDRTMARDDLLGIRPEPTTYCDLTQSWSAKGGGVGTYIRHKRRHILDHGPHRHVLIIPGERDATLVEEDGRAITVTIASPRVPGSPNYRLLLRNRAVRAALARYRPDLIECQDAYNLPWAAVAHRRALPGTALVAAYCTDFPTVYVERAVRQMAWRGRSARSAARLSYAYAAKLYRRFDAVFAMSENGGAAKLRSLGVGRVDVVPLGVELGEFSPDKRSAGAARRAWRWPTTSR